MGRSFLFICFKTVFAFRWPARPKTSFLSLAINLKHYHYRIFCATLKPGECVNFFLGPLKKNRPIPGSEKMAGSHMAGIISLRYQCRRFLAANVCHMGTPGMKPAS
ncbi:hypothetical protein Dpo_3c02300 [Desulfotignum phosphitoxidans DSM 13687]|uniref:Uncharacterized protein n=1 Tax=Desulfotignum phosphitoxidans DSM 13687 TaxID=1286635 RepID=S0G622_9BACT|nr:hypothetical protein Dpo_3c02300 [Desulfotignum phosphitoxidans DSM 13687]